MFAFPVLLVAALTTAADLVPLLRHQGFTGPLNGREQIEYAGQISQGRTRYQVYTYHGVYRAAVVDHGVNRIIVVRSGTILLGEYNVAMPVRCKTRGVRVICEGHRAEAPKSITFTRHGPPAQIWFDGEVLEFRRYD